MRLIETDPDSGAELHQLTPPDRPCCNIYGEQPYGSADGTCLAVEIGEHGGEAGELALLDLGDGALHRIIAGRPRFPAFHSWGEYLYCQELVGNDLILRRFHYRTRAREDVFRLPPEFAQCSYGSVSGDHQYYVVCGGGTAPADRHCVTGFRLANGERQCLVRDERYHFKHEQFSRDGSNTVMIQANVVPADTPRGESPKRWYNVHLGILQFGREGMVRFAADAPHTPRPTGHEAWIGATAAVCFSTGPRENDGIRLWRATAPSGAGEPPPAPTALAPVGAHVSVSRCGRFWLVDALGEPGEPLYVGCFATGRRRRALAARSPATDTPWGNQWSHTHPYFTADNGWLIYTSTRSGLPQVYGAKLAAGFLDGLAQP